MEELKEKEDMDLSIEESITGELQPVEDNIPTPESENVAAPLLQRISTRQKMINQRVALYDEWINKLNEMKAREIGRLQEGISFFVYPLEQFMRGINASNKNIKSIKLPTGILHLRKSPDKLVIDPEYKPIEGQDFIITKKVLTVDKAALKKHIKETGECPTYADIEPGEQKFSYEVF